MQKTDKAALPGNQGQTWKSVRQAAEFARPASLFDRPMEITVSMLRGLRMVDETVVVHGRPPQTRRPEK